MSKLSVRGDSQQFCQHCDSVVLAAAFTRSKQRYGAPRLTDELRAQGYHFNVKTVAASLRRQGLSRQHCDSVVLSAAFTRSKQRYGAPRLTDELRAPGYHFNVKTVAASLRRQGLSWNLKLCNCVRL
ncbi:Transposase (plasmid) [Shigella dysenteriae 1617]|uniref:Transposase n=1 Tax=Shigella dysenteriae 1617 TaxID=754093 RepID=A0A0A7A5A9_SHIDY|nr:Transposase [Shigella dysenteriae 1617]